MTKQIPILKIFCLLVVYDKLTINEIAERVGICRSLTRKYVGYLRQAGVPVISECGCKGGVRIEKRGHSINQMYLDIIGE